MDKAQVPVHDNAMSPADMEARGWILNLDETCWCRRGWRIERDGHQWAVFGPIPEQIDPRLPDAGWRFKQLGLPDLRAADDAADAAEQAEARP